MVSNAEWPVFNKEQSTIDEYLEELELFMLARFGDCNQARKHAALRTAIGPGGRAVIATFNVQHKFSYEVNIKATQARKTMLKKKLWKWVVHMCPRREELFSSLQMHWTQMPEQKTFLKMTIASAQVGESTVLVADFYWFE